jgi:hypothetical protein
VRGGSSSASSKLIGINLSTTEWCPDVATANRVYSLAGVADPWDLMQPVATSLVCHLRTPAPQCCCVFELAGGYREFIRYCGSKRASSVESTKLPRTSPSAAMMLVTVNALLDPANKLTDKGPAI